MRLLLVPAAFLILASPASAADAAGVLAGTPLWVWPALLLVVLMGLSRTRDREVTPARLVLLPLLIMGLALSHLAALPPGLPMLAGTALGMIGGLALGARLTGRDEAKLLPNGRIWLRGDWVTLGLMLSIFAWRFASGVVEAVDPTLAASAGFTLLFAAVTALFTTVLVLRTALRLVQAYRGEAQA